MKYSKLFFGALMGVLVLVSCTKDDAPISKDGTYSKGVFILNEGSAGQGSVSFISDDLANFTQDVYGAENGTDLFGKLVQSVFFNGDNAYFIAGGSNKITIVNRKTFKLVGKIETGLANPRYGVAKDGKAYVTNAKEYSFSNPTSGNTDDYIAVINLTTNQVESKIELNATANRILLDKDKLYITEPYDNTKLLIVNTATQKLETPINIGSGADAMEIKDGILYTLINPFGSPSELVKIKLSDNTKTTISFPTTLTNVANLDVYENKIYFTSSKSVYAIDSNATAVTAIEPLFSYNSTSNIYSFMYGFAVNKGRVYIGDAGDFKKDSKAYIYTLNGTLLKELTVGVGPNGFYFND
jgi:hypothetical protein